MKTSAPLRGERKTSPTFITLTGESEDQLLAKIEQMNRRGFTQIGAIVSTKGVRKLPGPAEYVCLMSGYAGGEAPEKDEAEELDFVAAESPGDFRVH